MLKETENEETRLFCQIFVIGSSSSLFQSQRSLKSQLNRKQSMLTIISTGNREEAK